MAYTVLLTDQVFPSVEVEREILARAGATLEVLAEPTPARIREAGRTVDAVLTTYAPIDADTLGSFERCRVISRYGIGVDNIDLDAARARGVIVTNVPDYCVEEVADHTLALVLALARRLPQGHAIVVDGRWGVKDLGRVRRLRGRTLGLVGFGNIGAAVAGRARAFGLEVVVFDPYVDVARLAEAGADRAGSLDELLGAADIVSLHAPLTPETQGIIDRRAIDRMRPGAVLVNTSRGGLVETAAVLDALREGRLAGAGLDVFAQEPPAAQTLADVPNLLSTPHAAFYSEEAIRESQTKAAEAIVAVLEGREPRNRVV